jgi:transposase
MDDRTLHPAILGLQAPWAVARVELRVEPDEVEVWVVAEAGTPHACPDCAVVSAIHDHVERRWRHLDTCQFQTVLCARVPRVHCATHGGRTTRVRRPSRAQGLRCSSSASRWRGGARPPRRPSRGDWG